MYARVTFQYHQSLGMRFEVVWLVQIACEHTPDCIPLMIPAVPLSFQPDVLFLDAAAMPNPSCFGGGRELDNLSIYLRFGDRARFTADGPVYCCYTQGPKAILLDKANSLEL